jgi:hypothetical protein
MLEKPKRQSGMQNSETLATLGTQDTERRQTKQNKQHRKLKRDTTKYQVLTPVLMTGKQFMPLIRRPACYLYSPDVFDTTIHKQTQN